MAEWLTKKRENPEWLSGWCEVVVVDVDANVVDIVDIVDIVVVDSSSSRTSSSRTSSSRRSSSSSS